MNTISNIDTDSRAKIIIDKGVIRGKTPSGERSHWLEFKDDSGAAIVWVGETRAEALAAAHWLARGGLRVIDLTEARI